MDDSANFIIEMTKALAWPATATYGLWLLRRPLRQLFPKMRELKVAGVDIQFAQKVDEVAKEVAAATPPAPVQLPTRAEAPRAMLSARNPFRSAENTGRVIQAWSILETSLLTAVARRKLIPSTAFYVPIAKAVEALRGAGVLSNQQARNILELAALRNEAAHGRLEVETTTAEKFEDAALRLAFSLEEVAPPSDARRAP